MRSKWLSVLTLCLTSFVLAGVVARFGFDAMPHSEDEQANWFQAQVFAAGQVTAVAPAHAEAFPVQFVVQWNGRRFSKYPPGFSLLLVPAVWLGRPWLVNAVAAALGILGTFLLGRELFDHETGVMAAALGVLSPLYLLLSGTLLSHVTTLAALILFAWSFLRSRRVGGAIGRCYAATAGLCLGLAVLIRPWTAAAVAVPFLVLGVHDLAQRRTGCFGRYTCLLLTAAPVVALWPAYNWIATGSPLTNLYTLWWSFDRLGFGSDVGNQGYGGPILLANLRADVGGLLNLYLPFLRGLGWLLFGVSLAATGAPPGKAWRKWLLLAPPVALVVGYAAYWAGSGSLYGPRYYSEALPFLWILAASGLGSLRRQWSARWVNAALLVAVVAGTLTVTIPELLQRREVYGISGSDGERMLDAGLHHALVFVRGEHWTEYAALGWRNPPDLDSADVIYAWDLGCVYNSWVVADYPGRSVWIYDRTQAQPLTAWKGLEQDP